MISTYISDWEVPHLTKVEDKQLNELLQEVREIDDRFLIQTTQYDNRTWFDKLMSDYRKTGVVYTLYNHTDIDTQIINFPPLEGSWSINTSVHKAQIMAFFYGFLAGKKLVQPPIGKHCRDMKKYESILKNELQKKIEEFINEQVGSVKSEELRLGNWVHHSNNWSYRQPDQCFKEFDFQWEERDWYALGESTLQMGDIEPIELTFEWLERFDFERTTEISYHLGYEMPYYIYRLGEFTYNGIQAKWWYHGVLENQPEYVHQLQNLYYALTGKELEIRTP